MAMLAEPRRKQKWTLNPRGKHWSEDPNKYGQRMLEKMGWTAGKGLGSNEQGMTEHVRVSMKNDTAGVGFKMEDLDKAWTEYQEGFNDLLQELQKCQSSGLDDTVEAKCEPLDKKSLELKSKESRARVHYQKFTRGKDVHRYSAKDLANIFGQKELNINIKTKEDTEVQESYQNEPVGTKDKTAGVVTINSGSMADYFEKRGGPHHRFPESHQDNQSDNSDCEIAYVGFGFASKQNKEPEEISNIKQNACGFKNPHLRVDNTEELMNQNEIVKASKKRKIDCSSDSGPNTNNRRKKLKENTTTGNYMNGFVNPGLNLESTTQEAHNGKEFEVCRAAFGLTNSALDITDEAKDTKRVTFNDHVEYSDDSMKKKKGRATLDKFEVENKKVKRKRNQENSQNVLTPTGFVNEALDVQEVPEEINDNEVNERKSKKVKKRKESRRSNLETILEAPDEEKEIQEEPILVTAETTEHCTEDTNVDAVPDESFSKKKNKRKKKKDKTKEKHNLEDINMQTSVNETEDVNDSNEKTDYSKDEKKGKKKKKAKTKNSTDDTSLTEVNQEDAVTAEQFIKPSGSNGDVIEQPIERQDKFRISLKKKKKKKKEEENHNSHVITDENLNSTMPENTEERVVTEFANEAQESETKVIEDATLTKEKKKKKKKKSHISDVEVESSMKAEQSDKENTKINKEKSQSKKSKKSQSNKPESSILDENDCETEQVSQKNSDVPNDSQNVTDIESTPSKPKKNDENSEISKFISSPWSEKAKLSKKLLKSLFHRNVSNFPGSNIYEIKGYGVDV